jgi:putative tRNA adenosine deaminase-associated protein
MCSVAYFTAVVARAGRTWKARDVEVDDHESLDELTDALRSSAIDDQPVIAVIEHEDEWFALVRVDGEEEPRLFVSDLGAALHGAYADMLRSAADVDDPEDDEDPGDDKPGEDDDEGAQDDDEPVVAAWAGETDLLEDLGVTGKELRKLVDDHADDPGAVLADVGEKVGFSDLLQALR